MNAKAALAKLAHRHADVVDDVSCPGTSLEAATYCVNGKAFLFVSEKEPVTLRFKLGAALQASAKKAGVDVGAGGWAKLVLDDRGTVPAGMSDWIAESYALMAAAKKKKPAPTKKRAAKKRAAKKR